MKGVYGNIYFPCRWSVFRLKDPCREVYKRCRCVASYGILEKRLCEVVLDVKGCNLNCRACWGYKLRYFSEDIVKEPEDVLSDIKCRVERVRFLERKGYKTFALRVTGNEPSLQWEHVMELVRLVERERIFRKVIIETNGILFADKHELVEMIGEIKKVHLDIDISFKGVNPLQFKYIANAREELFYKQVYGFVNLFEFVKEKGLENVSVNPVLGLNHSKNALIIFPWGEVMDFYDYDEVFEREVLRRKGLRYDEAPFREYYGINKETAREIVAVRIHGRIIPHVLPSEANRYAR